jgi:two-component system, cell cycle sensor histidine kinase and response regulator CckA
MNTTARILVADDEPDLIEDYHCAFALPESGSTSLRLAELQDELFGSQHGNGSLPQVELVGVNQGEAAVQTIARSHDLGQPFSAAFLDVRMPPGMNGLEAAIKIREIDARLPIVIVTAYTDIQTIDLAKQIPPADRLFVLQKPFHTTEIQQLAIALTARRELENSDSPEISSVDLEALRRLEEVVRNLPGGVAVFDDNERLVRMNGELESLFPDMKQQLRLGARYTDLREGISQRMLPDRLVKRSAVGLTDGGAPLGHSGGVAARHLVGNRWMMIAERPQNTGGSVVQFLDITALKTAEHRRQIGTTMTHVSRFAEELVDRLEGATRRAVRETEFAAGGELAEAAQAMLQDLVPLAQRQELSPRPAMLDGIINELVATIAPRLPKPISLETVSSIGLWPVYVDCEQIKRALHALIANAVEAVDGRGSIYVEALNVRAGREATTDLPGLKTGEYVCVRVTDNGAGMPPDIVNRALMPYFTTKDPKTHKGMGLTMAYSTVMQSGGYLFIDSDGHSETQVRLFFPKAPGAVVSNKGIAGRH